jgi:hypothetical protein
VIAEIFNALLDDPRVLPTRRDAFKIAAKRSTTDGLRSLSHYDEAL